MASPMFRASAGVFKRLPAARLLAAAELVRLARQHMTKLEPHERRRVLELIRSTRGRPSRLSARHRRELMMLVAKAEPQLFVRGAVQKLTGVPLPNAGQRRRA